MRESTLERAAAEPRERADYPLLSTHPPNPLHATWRTCTRVQLAEDYRSVSPHATCDLALSIRPCNAFRIGGIFLSLSPFFRLRYRGNILTDSTPCIDISTNNNDVYVY